MKNEPREKKLIYPEELIKRYMNDYEPIPERDLVVNQEEFHAATMEKVLGHERTFTYFNHRGIYEDMHKPEFYKLTNMVQRWATDVGYWWRYKNGQSPNCESVPECEPGSKGPAMVISSGCSLNDALPLLKDWKGGIFCSTSQAASLVYYGAPPTHIVNLDCQANWGEMNARKWDYRKTIMISHPGTNPELIHRWKGPKMYYRLMDAYLPFYIETLPAGYGFISCEAYPFGSSVPTEMTMANRLGYAPLIMVGGDFALREKTRFDAMGWDKKKRRWVASPGSEMDKRSKEVMWIKSASGRITNFMHLHYRKATGVLQWIDGMNVMDCSDGIMNGFWPKHDIKEVIETQGRCCEKDMVSKEKIREWIGPWLAMQDTFWLEMPEGYKLTNIPKWRDNLDGILAFLKQHNPEMDVAKVRSECFNLAKKAKENDYGESTPAS